MLSFISHPWKVSLQKCFCIWNKNTFGRIHQFDGKLKPPILSVVENCERLTHPVIITIQNLFSLLPPKYFFQASQELTINSEIDFNEVLRILDQLGYSRVERVDSLNEYSVRGGIIDINPSHTSHGIRLDFFGDKLESIREL